MNIWLRLVFVAVRAGLIAFGTLMVQRGWIDQATADTYTGDAAIWISSGLFVIVSVVGASAWEKIKHAAMTRLALMFPSGTSAGTIVATIPLLAKRSLWILAKGLTKDLSDVEARRLTEAQQAVIEVLSRNGEPR